MMTIQRQKIFALLSSRKGEWVPLPDILALGIAQYNARIYELRRSGLSILNKTKKINGMRMSWYQLSTPGAM